MNENDSPNGTFAPFSLGKISRCLFGVHNKDSLFAWLMHPSQPASLSLYTPAAISHFLRGYQPLPPPIYTSSLSKIHRTDKAETSKDHGEEHGGGEEGVGVIPIITSNLAGLS